MPGINLILSDQLDKQKPFIRVIKSSTNQVLPLPFSMDSYSPLIDSLQDLVPYEWQTTIENLRNEERALIKKRKALMTEYKLTFAQIITPIIETYQKENPELFI
ncbi:MAG: hypothetical protein ACYDD5_00980 [Sulfuricurvum sp.]